jgi:hypothetical protein
LRCSSLPHHLPLGLNLHVGLIFATINNLSHVKCTLKIQPTNQEIWKKISSAAKKISFKIGYKIFSTFIFWKLPNSATYSYKWSLLKHHHKIRKTRIRNIGIHHLQKENFDPGDLLIQACNQFSSSPPLVFLLFT